LDQRNNTATGKLHMAKKGDLISLFTNCGRLFDFSNLYRLL